MKLTKKQQKELMAIKITYKDAQMFYHCQNCMSIKPDNIAPCDWARGTMTNVIMKYPNGKNVAVVAFFCERCKAHIWDTRHLDNLF